MTTRVNYSVFSKWWAWAKADGYETAIVPVANQIAAGPTISCVAGFVVFPFLAGCLYVAKPQRGPLYLELVPRPEPRPAPSLPSPARLRARESDPEVTPRAESEEP